MQCTHRLIEAAETASHENFTESQRKSYRKFAYKMDDQDESLGLLNHADSESR